MKGLLAVILGLIAVVLFFWLIKAPIVSSYLTSKMKVPVNVGSLSIGPSKTVIRHFQINNPRGFKSRAAFKANEIEIDYRTKALFHNPSEIDVIDVRDIFLSIELKNLTGTDNNWTAIGANIETKQTSKELVI